VLTGVCFQWRGSASYDSDVHIETFVLRGKFSGKIATKQQPPTVSINSKTTDNETNNHIDNLAGGTVSHFSGTKF